jgi:uncharacterized protein DUF3822
MTEVLKIKTDKNIYPSESVLLMEIGEAECSFGIMHHASRIIYQYEYWKTEQGNEDELLKKIFEENEILGSPFYRTALSYYMPACVLIPNKLYDADLAKTWLEKVYGENSGVVISEALPEWQLHSAYKVPALTHETINRHYTAGNFWHQYSVILKNVSGSPIANCLVVDFKADSFSAVLVHDNKLMMGQIFSYVKAEDVLYYLLKICHEFLVSQNEVNVVLSGLIDKNSSVFKELHQYFLNIEFAEPQNHIQLSEGFHDYPSHFFTSLSRLAACVS